MLSDRILDHRRRGFLAAAVAILAFLPLDLAVGMGPALAPVRIAWAAAVLATRALQRPGHRARANGAVLAISACTGAFGTAVVALSGGADSPRLGFLLALPLIVLALVPELPAVGVLAALGCGAGGAWLLAAAGRPAVVVVDWCLVALAVAAVDLYGSLLFRRLYAGELAHAQERAATLAQRAQVERRAAEVEHLAQVARLAGEAAHGIANPLSAVKSGVALLAALAPAENAEAREVAADVAESLARIERLAAELQRLSHPPPPGPQR